MSKFNLNIIGVIEGTDKSSSIDSSWDYLRHYEIIFESFRNEPINFIEIGVLHGASLKVWKSFFTRARFIGIDIAPASRRFADDRVSIEIGSQDDPGFLAQVCAKYPPSIIVDDGSHRADHIMYTFERMFPAMLAGGIYIVEDVAFHFGENAKHWKGTAEASPVDYFMRMVRSCLARSVQDVPAVGTARYTLQTVDAIEVVPGALVIHKKAASPNIRDALDFADEYLRGREPDANIHQRIGQFILRHDGPLDRAEAELKRAIEIGGETPERLHICSEIYAKEQRLPEAAAMAERAASLSRDAHRWNHAGKLRTAHGDHAAAASAYRHATAIQPGNVEFALRLSDALERQGKLAEALAALQRDLKVAVGTAEAQTLHNRTNTLKDKMGAHS